MTLVNLTGAKTDAWTLLDDGQMPAATDRVAVPFRRLEAEADTLFATGAQIGAIIGTDVAFADLAPLAGKLAFAIIAFPAFGDGRGFSLAVRLRKDFGFTGEIRAIGPVIPDQAMHLTRAGFDTVEVDEKREAAFRAALKRYGLFYQSDYVGQRSLAHLRHEAPAEARKAS